MPGPGWHRAGGVCKWSAVLVAVTSCRSDRSRCGVLPGAHLADGRLTLLLVPSRGRLALLSWLLRLARGRGAEPASGVQVEHVDGVVVREEVAPPPHFGRGRGRMLAHASWNVDGELLVAPGGVALGVVPAAVNVFARGVELPTAQI